MIRHFKETSGRYIEKIMGQDRFAFGHLDTNDFYDLIEWSKTGGSIRRRTAHGGLHEEWNLETKQIPVFKAKIREHHYGDMIILKCCLNIRGVLEIIEPNQTERRYWKWLNLVNN